MYSALVIVFVKEDNKRNEAEAMALLPIKAQIQVVHLNRDIKVLLHKPPEVFSVVFPKKLPKRPLAVL